MIFQDVQDGDLVNLEKSCKSCQRLQNHSFLSATNGSTFVARRAGT